MLELAADLCLLDESANQLGVIAVLLQQDLDGKVASQVGVAALENDPHAAPGDHAEELQPTGAVGHRGHLGGGRLDHGTGAGRRIGVAEQDQGHPAQRLGQRDQKAR